MKLKIKPEYIGLTITKNHYIVGQITFDPSRVKPEEYINYKNFGFDIFSQVQETIQDQEEMKPKQIKTIEYKGVTDYNQYSLNELRQLFPHIKSNSKVNFIEKIK